MSYVCGGCREPIKDGEFVAIVDKKKAFHLSHPALSHALDCTSYYNRGLFNMDMLVHYKEKFYTVEQLIQLPNAEELSFEVIRARDGKCKGNKIMGNLEGLAKLDAIDLPEILQQLPASA